MLLKLPYHYSTESCATIVDEKLGFGLHAGRDLGTCDHRVRRVGFSTRVSGSGLSPDSNPLTWLTAAVTWTYIIFYKGCRGSYRGT